MERLAAVLLSLGGSLAPIPVPVPADAPASTARAREARFAESAVSVEFKGYLSSWIKDEGDLPRPLVLDRAVRVRMAVPRNPGEATTAAMGTDLEGLGVGVSFFAVCPHGSLRGGDGSCAELYYQVQVALSGKTKAFCASSLSKRDALPFPVQQCGAPDRDDASRMIGATLHREPFAKRRLSQKFPALRRRFSTARRPRRAGRPGVQAGRGSQADTASRGGLPTRTASAPWL